MPNALNLTNKRNHRLIAIKLHSPFSKKGRFWVCKCDCGKTSYVRAAYFFKTKSCGCLRLEKIVKPYNVNSPEYSAWAAMKNRTTNTNNRSFHRYGYRGIKVCESWSNSFENFIKDMGQKPTKNHSIDRIDNDSDYTPQNCRWATKKEQSNNTRTNRFITFNHETKTIAEWARKLNMNYETLLKRLSVSKWSVEKSLTTPVR